jgi:tellurite methyltransferase
MTDSLELYGNIDIYLFDQILKNRFHDKMRVLDAGCGGGRNLYYFLRNGFNVFGTDQSLEAIEHNQLMAKMLAPDLPQSNFQLSSVEKMPFEDNIFDLVISNAVLHFAENEQHFRNMLIEMWRVVKSQGILFVRLASSIGIEKLIEPLGNGRYYLPDESERFLVDESLLAEVSKELNAMWLEPLKTTNVQNLRCMTTLVWQKT